MEGLREGKEDRDIDTEREKERGRTGVRQTAVDGDDAGKKTSGFWIVVLMQGLV